MEFKTIKGLGRNSFTEKNSSVNALSAASSCGRLDQGAGQASKLSSCGQHEAEGQDSDVC